MDSQRRGADPGGKRRTDERRESASYVVDFVSRNVVVAKSGHVEKVTRGVDGRRLWKSSGREWRGRYLRHSTCVGINCEYRNVASHVRDIREFTCGMQGDGGRKYFLGEDIGRDGRLLGQCAVGVDGKDG